MKKSRIVPALSFGSCFRSNLLHAEFPAQSRDTDQSTAEQHERHTAVGNLVSNQPLINRRAASARGKPVEIADIVISTTVEVVSASGSDLVHIGTVNGQRTTWSAGHGNAVDYAPNSPL